MLRQVLYRHIFRPKVKHQGTSTGDRDMVLGSERAREVKKVKRGGVLLGVLNVLCVQGGGKEFFVSAYLSANRALPQVVFSPKVHKEGTRKASWAFECSCLCD